MIQFSSVLNARGRIGRGGYLGAGVLLFSSKFAIDFSVVPGAAALLVKTLTLEIFDELAGTSAHIHVREFGLLPKN